jgi:hypothetical protein
MSPATGFTAALSSFFALRSTMALRKTVDNVEMSSIISRNCSVTLGVISGCNVLASDVSSTSDEGEKEGI